MWKTAYSCTMTAQQRAGAQHEFHETHSVTFYFRKKKKTPDDAVTPLRQSQFTPKMKANAVPRLLSSLVWIDHYNECNGMTTFMEFMFIVLKCQISASYPKKFYIKNDKNRKGKRSNGKPISQESFFKDCEFLFIPSTLRMTKKQAEIKSNCARTKVSRPHIIVQ